MQTASELYGQLAEAGVLLELGDGGTLVADNTPALAPFVPAIREQKEALREIVMRRNASLYAWIGSECLVSKRVTTATDHLWKSYAAFCALHSTPAVRADFERLVKVEFPVERGMVVGLSLISDWEGYKPGPECKARLPLTATDRKRTSKWVQ